MINVRFEFNKGWEKDLAREISGNVAKLLQGVTCPEHGERPRVVVKGRGLEDMSFEVHGCCESLIQKALSRLQ
jgi:hypothetical protein